MSACWYCYWGWPRPIRDIYDAAAEEFLGDETALLYGPAHVVWADEDWMLAQHCLDHFDEWVRD